MNKCEHCGKNRATHRFTLAHIDPFGVSDIVSLCTKCTVKAAVPLKANVYVPSCRKEPVSLRPVDIK